MSHTRVLVVDADATRARTLVELLAPAGYESWHASAAGSSVEIPDVVVLSLDVVDPAVVTRVAAANPDADLLLLVDGPSRARAREALRVGTGDVVERDAGTEALLFAVERAAREGRQRRELATLRARVGDEARRALVGHSPGMTMVRELVGRAAASRRTVLVTGEAGTGKNTVARVVHDLSDRAARPFVIARCAGADAGVLEAELFGGAREGLLETARGGTLVLDEVRELPRSLYARLATMLAERTVQRDAGEALAVDVRLVLTSRTSDDEPPVDPYELLGDRNVLPIALPPLRERRRDIPQLVQHFRARQVQERGSPLPPLGPDTMTPLLAHQWPGNVRELEHWMDRIALAAAEGAGASPRRSVVAPGADFAQLDAARLTLDALERKYILHVLAQERGHQSRAADRLGIDRRTLYRKLKEYRDDGVTVRIAG